MPDHGAGSRKMLENDFWDVSSMKQKMVVGIWPVWGMVGFEKISTGWRSSCGLII
jgi:hypothetical protein